MPHERSQSRVRNHRRDRSHSRERHRDDYDRSRDKDPRHKSRHRHRSRSPRRRDSRERDREGRLKNYRRSRTRSRSDGEEKAETAYQAPVIDSLDLEGKTEDEIEMLTMMGFAGFDTTKGKPVSGNDIYVANIQKKRKYRQYMNRRGGFNRPLDAV